MQKTISLLIRFFLILWLWVSPSVWHAKGQATARDLTAQAPESYIRLSASDISAEVNSAISVDYIKNDSAYAYANTAALKLLRERHISFQALARPGEVDFDLRMKSMKEIMQKGLTESWDFYPTYEAYEELMYQFEEDYPDLCSVYSIVELDSERQILFARITSPDNTPGTVPQVMYTSTMHGDETAGFILSLRLIHYLLTHYGIDEEATQMMQELEIWISPNENPDGTYTNDNSTVNGATRGNANGVDLNRNYPNPVSNPWHAQQAETTAMIAFSDTMNFVLSANMHGGIELVNFPFDSWTSTQKKHADHEWWEYVMYEYVDTVRVHAPSTYMTGMGDGVTHGGDWYVVYGSRQDFFNYYRGCREFTLELSNQKLLNPTLLPAHWNYNHRSLINYLKQATYGIRGVVQDGLTGEPLEAWVEIPEYDHSNSRVSSHPTTGYFYRFLSENTYSLLVHANGYHPTMVHTINVVNHQRTDIEVALWPLDYAMGDVNADGELNLQDVALLADYILGHPVENFFPAAADLNGDGIIDILDITTLIQIILSGKNK